MARAVGIDLGTTNSLVGYSWRGRETLVPDPAQGREWMPSLVGLDQAGAVIVGSSVEMLVEAGHARGVHSVKRLMGRRWDDPQVRRLIDDGLLSYEIVEHPDRPGEIGVVLGEDVFTPTEISSMILRQLKENAQAQMGDTVSHAVITVPAYFRDPAILATREAGRLAGLRVKHVMPEPSAAALAYGADDLDDGSGRYVLVYDFGGGTFDVSIILAAAGTLNVLRVGGDNFLGGDDVDRAVMERFDEELGRAHRVSFLTGAGLSEQDTADLKALQWRLKLIARKAKEAVSTVESTTVIQPALMRTSGGRLVDATWTLSRSDLQTLAGPLIDRTMDAVTLALSEASLAATDINQVVVAGGSSRIPGVVDRLRAMFVDSEILNAINPMTAIAAGAVRASRAPFPWTCPACERENELTADTCVGCGARPPSELHPCDSCGAFMEVTEEQCPNPRCQTRVARHVIPVEANSHNFQVRVVGDWSVLVARDTPIEPTLVHGTAPSPWKTLFTSSANMERIDLPIAQDVDEDDEDPEVIAIFATVDAPTDLPEGEPVEVRLHLSGSGIAEAEVRIRGTHHLTRRLDSEELAALADDESTDLPADDWTEAAKGHMYWLRMIVSARHHLPATARSSANVALLHEVEESIEIADDYADRLEAAIERKDRVEAEELVASSEEEMDAALPVASTVGFANLLASGTDDPVARRELLQALQGLQTAIRDGGPDDPPEAFAALRMAISEVRAAEGDAADVPMTDRHLLRATQG